MKNTSHLRTRALTEGALFVGLAFLLGYVKLWHILGRVRVTKFKQSLR